MQNGGGRLKLGYSGEVKMRRGGGDPRGNTVESVPHGAGASDCPICPEAGAPHGHTGLRVPPTFSGIGARQNSQGQNVSGMH